jgi:hypothetical protein
MDLRPKICQAQNVAEEMRINKGRLEELERDTIFVDPKEVVPAYSQPPKKFALRRKAV